MSYNFDRKTFLCVKYTKKLILGGITEGFEFQMDEDTQVYSSCSAQLNGDVYVFGGASTSNNERRQVDQLFLKLSNHFFNITFFISRSQRLLTVN